MAGQGRGKDIRVGSVLEFNSDISFLDNSCLMQILTAFVITFFIHSEGCWKDKIVICNSNKRVTHWNNAVYSISL